MKKTISVNLSNRQFYIEEEAYQMLHAYLQGITDYYRHSDPEGEIVSDIESRLGELFEERVGSYQGVITAEITREVMQQTGPLEEIMGEDDKEYSTDTEPGYGDSPIGSSYGEKESGRDGSEQRIPHDGEAAERTRRKLYKSNQGGLISGLFAGIARYSDINAYFLRIAYIILVILMGKAWFLGMVIYIVLAMVIPTARTVSQRMELEGKPVNPDTLWDQVVKESSSTVHTMSNGVQRIVSRRRRGFSWDTDGLTISDTEASPESSPDKPTSRLATRLLYWLIGIALLISVVVGIGTMAAMMMTADANTWDYGIWSAVPDLPDTPGGLYRMLPIVLIAVFIAIVIFAAFLCLLALPLYFLLRSHLSMTWKVAGLISWVVVMYLIFG